MSEIDGKVNEKVVQWVTFCLGDETYGIMVMQVQEVLRIPDIAPVPGSADHVVGIINLRGNVVTVVDSRHRFGLPPKELDDASRIVVTEVDNQIIGILVDSVAEVVELKSSDIEAAPNVGNDESAKYIQGVSSQNGKLLILVDLIKFLDIDELVEMECL
ncbi:MAG: chemotaxis protein CheW [Methylococcaceae bacterium]|nr:chemotaxis protein CheW [Methylococcaceae bacterium]MCI0667190.1 chemotaxis protein CheW [Methylococcaceae bacterium]MCI0732337.1 chemotaxis protein CheW [Methylococcaceae bacterium]